MKQCKVCKEFKDDEQFALTGYFRKRTQEYARLTKCRECNKITTRKHKQKYYENNKELCKQRTKEHQANDPNLKEKRRIAHQAKREERNAKMKAYAQTEAGKAVRQRAQEKYRSRPDYNLKQNARKKVLRAVKSGKLVKPSCCEDCKQELFLEAHHIDYNKPLDVQWLCKTCHEKTHHLNEGHES
ncbi:endonuclease [Bacillus phage Moonbeam]|uniref:Homing endonuclease n=1 Tax=Bacillus phage Moonbeam TaxID=1540091 RepID=A0A0A0RV62_9CAUD|nr:endonuclease [Bacillus phage Moonbeam]AIW03513.1 homing endonuclease [Bacillus phage Moonbeam]